MRVFEMKRKVRKDETDRLGHVNNIVYLKWFMEAADGHAGAVGWPLSKMIKEGEGWVVRKHELNYMVALLPGEDITVRTWISSRKRASCVRNYEVIRKKDGKPAAQGTTLWVWINYKTGRIAHIPEEVVQAYKMGEYEKA